MKIHIAFDLSDTPSGGGNQFLKALRVYLRSVGAYAERFDEANIILVNGHHWGPYLFQLFNAKRKDPNLIILHRVDGPMAEVRGHAANRIIDDAIIRFNNVFADGTVFQSSWSRGLCFALGMSCQKTHTIILNAPDASIFYRPSVCRSTPGRRIKIISTSWSDNWRKGFDILKYLDEHLDFSRFVFTFVGNSPINFTNIRSVAPLSSERLADELRDNDIFLSASQLEACSNSLIEAINCGLVPVARNNSSHPEIVGRAGTLFEGIEDVIEAIEKAGAELLSLRNPIRYEITMASVGPSYLNFACRLIGKSASKPSFYAYLVTWIYWKLAHRSTWIHRINVMISRLWPG